MSDRPYSIPDYVNATGEWPDEEISLDPNAFSDHPAFRKLLEQKENMLRQQATPAIAMAALELAVELRERLDRIERRLGFTTAPEPEE